MTDLEVLAILDELERLLEAPVEPLEAQAIAQWHDAFMGALASAQRGPRWPEIRQRAKALETRLHVRVASVREAQRAVQRELEQGALGQRALAGYRTGRR